MADYSQFFPQAGDKPKDYSEFFPTREQQNPVYREAARQNQEAQDRAIYSPVVGMGPVEAMKVAAGRGLNLMAAGATQPLVSMGSSLFTDLMGSSADLARDQAERKSQYEPVRQMFPLSTAVGEALPYMAIPASAGALTGSAIVGGLEGLKYGTPQERATNAAIGFGANLIGNVAGKIAGTAFQPFSSDALNTTKRAALESASDIGFKPRLSQTTGSPFWNRVEDWSARIPGGAGIMQKHEAANAQAVNRAAAQSIGENADELTPEVLSRARTRLGKVFDDIKTQPGRPIQIDSNVGTVADDILRQQSKKLSKNTELIDIATQAKALAQNRGRIDGETYQLVRSDLSNAAFEATGTEKTMYGRLLEALDGAAESSLRGLGLNGLADSLKTARPQYANLMAIEKGTTIQGGNVSPARVAQTMRTQNPAAFREARNAGNPLYSVAQIGENLPYLREGSQTFQREAMGPSLLFTAPLAYAGAKVSTSPSFNWYMQNVAPRPVMGALSQLANPPVRAIGTGGVLNMLVPPVMAEH